MSVSVSAVVPTRNRPESLARLLDALARQTRAVDEIIVVDASDPGRGAKRPDNLPVRRFTTAPGVCAQRNLGIREARGSWILLLDDDVEPAPDYLERLLAHVAAQPDCGAVTGLITEPDRSGHFGGGLPDPSLRHALFAFLFQTSVFGDTESLPVGTLTRPLSTALRAWYRKRGNTWSLAGWPLVTQTREAAFRTAVYGLGAALVRRDWLLASPFDEVLGPHGIGDNYGVALGFPGPGGIDVLGTVAVHHHRSPVGRLSAPEASYRRVLALDYFMRRSPSFTRLNTLVLAWSQAGQAAMLAVRGRLAGAASALKALFVVASGTNPLLGGGSGGGPESDTAGRGG